MRKHVPNQLEFRVTTPVAPASQQANLEPARHSDGSCQPQILVATWSTLIEHFFPNTEHLYSYTCRWSGRRQKRTLASCNLEKRRIRVAQELNDPLFYRTLSPLLYHEMCHAVLEYQVSTRNGKHLWHGPEFKALEGRHPDIAWLDLWIQGGGWRYAVARHRAKNRSR